MASHLETVKQTDSERLADTLRHQILEGKFAPTEPFPSLRQLSKRYGVGLRVVRTAVDSLVKEGLLYRRERSGTFVRLLTEANGLATSAQAIKCVNIVERTTGTLPGFVRADYLYGHTQALEAFHIKMRVARFPEELASLPTALSERYVFAEQGCILVNIIEPGVFDWLNEHAIPFVIQNYVQYSKEGLPPHHSVAVNKVGGAFAATRRLIELGHQRIGYAGCPPDQTDDLTEIYQGYRAAMETSGLEARAADIMPYDPDMPHLGFESAVRWLKKKDLPTAMVARNDMTAFGILRAARMAGICVPEDLSVIGFDDQAEAVTSDPPLSTVAAPRVQLGRTAVEILLNAASGDLEEPETRVLECHLVERATTAPRLSE